MTKLNIPLIDLKLQKIISEKESYIELHEDYLHRVMRCIMKFPEDDDDPNLEWKENNIANENKILRKHCVAVEKWYAYDSKAWGIAVVAIGLATDIKLYFKKESQATEVLDILWEWVKNQ